MALLNIYTLRDTRTEAFHRPFFLQNRAVLERAIHDALSDENNMICLHPEDYQIYSLGTYDERTGEITPTPATHLFNAIDVKGDNNA